MIDDRVLAILWRHFCEDPTGNPAFMSVAFARDRFIEWLREYEPPEHPGPLLAAVLSAYGPGSGHQWAWTSVGYFCARCEAALTPHNANGECAARHLPGLEQPPGAQDQDADAGEAEASASGEVVILRTILDKCPGCGFADVVCAECKEAR